jgi:hypothetical protein
MMEDKSELRLLLRLDAYRGQSVRVYYVIVPFGQSVLSIGCQMGFAAAKVAFFQGDGSSSGL